MCDGTSVTEFPWKQVTRKEFIYAGSCLGPFKVKNAVIWECTKCGGTTLLASIAKGWEVEKALEIIEKASFYSPLEMKFIRQICGKTHSELALELDVPVQDVLRWESNRGIGGSPGDSRRLARFFLRQEDRVSWITGGCDRVKRIKNKVRMKTED